MALRKLAGLIKFTTKAGLAGGTIYLYYEAGLWKDTDETIENYDKLQKEVKKTIDGNQDVKKWGEYITASVSSNVKPYSEAVADFRKEWLNYDVSVVSSPINGMIKPAWNKGVTWTVETVGELPANIPKWGTAGWQKMIELATSSTSESPKSTTPPTVAVGSKTAGEKQ